MNLYLVSTWVASNKKKGRITGVLYEFEAHCDNEERAREAVRMHMPAGHIRSVQPIFATCRLINQTNTED